MSSTPAQSRAMFASQVHTSPSAAKRGTKLVLEAAVGTNWGEGSDFTGGNGRNSSENAPRDRYNWMNQPKSQ